MFCIFVFYYRVLCLFFVRNPRDSQCWSNKISKGLLISKPLLMHLSLYLHNTRENLGIANSPNMTGQLKCMFMVKSNSNHSWRTTTGIIELY